MEKEPHFAQIQKLRKKGWTYEEIGLTLNITKQRVHQIYKKYGYFSSGKYVELLGGACEVCKTKINLEVHHKNGRNDNRLESLSLLCRKHHRLEESNLYRSTDKERDILNGSKGRWKLCKECKKNKFWIVPAIEKMGRGTFCSFACRVKNLNQPRVFTHGARAVYRRGCRCFFCVKTESAYQLEKYHKKKKDKIWLERRRKHDRDYYKKRKPLVEN